MAKLTVVTKTTKNKTTQEIDVKLDLDEIMERNGDTIRIFRKEVKTSVAPVADYIHEVEIEDEE